MEFKYIPNILTLLRIALILPFLMAFQNAHYKTAFYLYLIASFSDALDGWLARLFHWQSRFGSFIDPMADKLLVVSSMIALALSETLPWWFVILVLMRDLTIALGILAWYSVIKRHPDFKPTLLSKANTVLQLILVTVCLSELAFHLFPLALKTVLIYITTFTTGASYLDYVWTWSRKACQERRIYP